MKPIAIFQHDATQRAGYLLEFLQNREIPCRLFVPEEGDAVPTDAGDFSGFAFLGSPHSVNDPLPWIEAESDLIHQAMMADKPVLGHCFGGQLMAKTLGATVARNPRPQIGWGKVSVTQFKEARAWFGNARELELFHWHYESFSIPRGAKRVLFGRHSLNKGFAIGKHLGLQCHLEVTDDIVREWCETGTQEIDGHRCASVQCMEKILHGLPQRLARLHRMADRVYGHWITGLDRPLQLAVPDSTFWTPARSNGRNDTRSLVR